MCDTLGCGAACELHGECYKAKCYCDIGWGGDDCSTQLLSTLAAATPAATASAGGASLKIKASFTANSLAELTAQEDGIKTAMAAWLGVGAANIKIEWASARRRLLATYAVRGAPLLGAAAACCRTHASFIPPSSAAGAQNLNASAPTSHFSASR
jgi:hypothetical protein